MNTRTGRIAKYAIFIEPPQSLGAVIRQWKAAVRRRLGDQLFLSHPPHSTMLVFDSRADEHVLVRLLGAAAARAHPFRASVRGVVILAAESSDGGNAVAYRIRSSLPMLRLQRAAAEAVLTLIAGNRGAFPCRSRAAARASAARYGFQFVGGHWLPHFTIAALKVPLSHPLVSAFRGQDVACDFVVDSISLWRVSGDRHTRLATIPLGRK